MSVPSPIILNTYHNGHQAIVIVTRPKNVKEMLEVKSFTIGRSDGVYKYIVAGSTILNEPDPPRKTIDGQAPARSYSKIPIENDRSRHWCLKLGELLKQEAAKADDGIPWMLRALPEGYTLWEHAGDEDGEASARKERVDVYLYGHPGGKSRRFRSPGDFLPHLLWLCQMKGPCKCKPCQATLKDGGTRLYLIDNAPSPQDMAAGDTLLPAQEDTVMTEYGIESLPAPDLPSDTRSLEQNFDSDPAGLFMYRPGELVWFNKGSAWGLAVICRRQAPNSIPYYLLQPLSHPLKHLPALVKGQDLIRPWLAWSVPSTTHEQIAHLTYDQVPWVQVLNHEFGPGDPEVDGSILAAKRVDTSYTLFNRVDMPGAGPGEVFYSGMFVGAEKIWVGETVRLRVILDLEQREPLSGDASVLVIHQIIETTTGTMTDVTLVGDVYKCIENPIPYKSRSQWPTMNLPARMISDIEFRNEVAQAGGRGIWYHWYLLHSMVRKSLSCVKGRWHESKALLPILRGAEYQHDISKGMTSDAGSWMNGRGADRMTGAGQRMKNRLDTLGRSVPSDLKISRGLDGPPSENEFLMEQPHNRISHVSTNESQYGVDGSDADAGIESYLNLDHTSDNQGWMQRGN